MQSIVYVGLDVHKESITVCSYTIETDKLQYAQKLPSDYKLVLKYIEQMKRQYPNATEYICGYEAGCMGYSLYHQLTNAGQKCVILAPTTMAITNTSRIKTDKRDAGNIAKCLAFGTYSAVYVPTDADKANERLRRRFYRMTQSKGINRNKATTAIARELACFMWGMITGNVA